MSSSIFSASVGIKFANEYNFGSNGFAFESLHVLAVYVDGTQIVPGNGVAVL